MAAPPAYYPSNQQATLLAGNVRMQTRFLSSGKSLHPWQRTGVIQTRAALPAVGAGGHVAIGGMQTARATNIPTPRTTFFLNPKAKTQYQVYNTL